MLMCPRALSCSTKPNPEHSMGKHQHLRDGSVATSNACCVPFRSKWTNEYLKRAGNETVEVERRIDSQSSFGTFNHL